MNLDQDFQAHPIHLSPDYEGEVKAVLVASCQNTGRQKRILYLHGYVDYFFHPHVAEQCHANGFDFYALDLRKYGRALLSHQHPNYCKDVREYYPEITKAIREIKDNDNDVYLLAHSTGGLIACCYMNEGTEKNTITGLILNSPFLDFNQSRIEKFLSLTASKLLSSFSNYAKIKGALAPVYAESIHKDYHGEWDFNLKWKPIKGFPTYFKWVVAIDNAQKRLRQSNISVPILLMHASNSLRTTKHSDAVMQNDIVLNIDDMKRIGPTLGDTITLLPIQNAQHDIFLSKKDVRDAAFEKMFQWLKSN